MFCCKGAEQTGNELHGAWRATATGCIWYLKAADDRGLLESGERLFMYILVCRSACIDEENILSVQANVHVHRDGEKIN